MEMRFANVAVVLAAGTVAASAGCFGSSARAPTTARVLGPASACPAARVHRNGLPGGPRSAGIPPAIPWVGTAGGSITATLFYYEVPSLRDSTRAVIGTDGEAGHGVPTKVLWWVRGRGSPKLTTVGQRRDHLGSFHQTITGPSLGDNTTFPSLVIIPTPDCWTLTVRSGTTSGSITFQAVRLNT
jgi:hypothetical protein